MSTMPYAVKCSDLKDASAVVKASAGTLWGIEVTTDGTNTATVTVYDSATATTVGKTVLSYVLVAGAARFDGHDWSHGVACSQGLYVTLSGTGAKFILYYS